MNDEIRKQILSDAIRIAIQNQIIIAKQKRIIIILCTIIAGMIAGYFLR